MSMRSAVDPLPSLPPWIDVRAQELRCTYDSVVENFREKLSYYNNTEDLNDSSFIDIFLHNFSINFRTCLIAIAGLIDEIPNTKYSLIRVLVDEDNLIIPLLDEGFRLLTCHEVSGMINNGEIDLDEIIDDLCKSIEIYIDNNYDDATYNPDYDIIIRLLNEMGHLVAGVYGGAGDRALEVITELITPLQEFAAAYALDRDCDEKRLSETGKPYSSTPRSDQNEARADPIARLHGLTGLSGVKEEVQALVNLARTFALRRERGYPIPDMSFHLIFTGNPGTGKTTVARIIAEIYGQLGLLSKGHLVETDRSGLVGGYVGQTAIKTKEVVESAIGGVLFIDEAYTLKNSVEWDSYGQEAIDTLLKMMEDNRDNIVVIAAGYTHEMERFIQSNPGLQSRFSRTIDFPDYTALEMVEIFENISRNNGYKILGDAAETLPELMRKIIINKGEKFSNARDARKLFENTIKIHAGRLSILSEVSDEELTNINKNDIVSGFAI